MYPEFIAIYVGLGVIIALLVAILCLLIKRTSGNKASSRWVSSSNIYQGEAGAIVFCKNCATKFNSLQHVCPKCGTPR